MCVWDNKADVIHTAKGMGKGMVVFKHPERDNYNITHASRTDRYQAEWVVYRT